MGDSKRMVAITGMGIVSSIGNSIPEFTASLKEGKHGIKKLENMPAPEISVTIGGQIKNFSFEAGLEKYTLLPAETVKNARQFARRSSLPIQASVLATLEAWENSGLYQEQLKSDRIGIVVSGSNLSQNYTYGHYDKFRNTPEYLTPSYALHYMDTDHLGVLSQLLGVKGEGFTAGGASASGNVALIQGFRMVQSGIVDACLVVGALADLSPMELQGFYNLGGMGGKGFAEEPEKACRPFDKDHEGFIYGQAGGCILLEAYDSASARGASIHAFMLGGAIALDGNRLSDPNEEGEARTMISAMAQGNVEASEVSYINAHGTSTPLGDITELKAIRRVFREHTGNIWINSTKGLTGHCLYSAGVVEGIATILQMEQGFVHPNRNLENPVDIGFRFVGKTSSPAELQVALSNSFGFGGINTSVVFKK
ncbi:beta-ketoacyl synthase N-terminal-like domain-containing protein [Ruminiclostridium josui]|uniref:beta-ketoacyl synthase N-terminal-like domain-containing protein n=1 Tax=Ruminiclostridium josui TaxID=1499 RepID=UPI0004653A44|nr:beta-ketoacyl synthase N-terminal-like domain-containing protein [Ruminiclostridium josui]